MAPPNKVVWYRCTDEMGNIYYFNSNTEKMTYVEPKEGIIEDQPPPSLEDIIKKARKALTPEMEEKLKAAKREQLRAQQGKPQTADWVEAYDSNSDAYYYWNSKTNETIWDQPESYVMAADDETMVAAIRIQCLYRSKIARKQMKDMGFEATDTAKTKRRKSIVVHGREIFIEEQADTMNAEATKWELEKLMIKSKKELEKIDEDATRWGEHANWSVGQYDTAYKALRNAEECNLVDAKDEFEVGGREIYNAVAEHVAKYEKAEGIRRAKANRAKRKERESQRVDERDRLIAQLKGCADTWHKYKTLEWKNSTMDPSINGPVLAASIPGSLFINPENYEIVKQIEGLITSAQAIVEGLPAQARDLLDKHLMALNHTVSDVAQPVQELDMVCRREMIRRQQIEDSLVTASHKDANNEKDAKAGNMVKGKLAKKKLNRAVGEGHKKSKTDAATRKIEHAEKVKKAGELKEKRAAAQRAMFMDLDEVRDDDDDTMDEHDLLQAEFNRKMFQSEQDKFEEKKKAKEDKEAAAKAVVANAAREEARQQQMYEMEQAKLTELKKIEEVRAAEEAVEKAKMEKIEQFKAIKEAQYHQERLRQEERDLVKNLARKKIEEDIARERAMLDEDEDDDEDEQEKRKECRKKLKIYHKKVLQNGKRGDVWEAVRTENVEMVKAYFMVQGTGNLLKMHNFTEGQGGRTLLHTACWWGCSKVIVLLMKLGANVNAIDTAMTKTTPLMEAARANKRTAVEILLRHGAAIRM
jgi:hypothetical protein